MHPAIVLIPAAGLILGPRLWARHVLHEYDEPLVEFPLTAGQLARRLLDAHGLDGVKVEVCEGGDHYDPQARAVRLSRAYHDRNSLTAVTVAAHEVAHALQHAGDYPPFVWRVRLARVAQVTVVAGLGLVLAIPLSRLVSASPLPGRLLGGAALGVVGTGMAARLSALPTELDASFNRALPMLQDGYIAGEQIGHARQILIASSLTYVASSVGGILSIWPWVGPIPISLMAGDMPHRSVHNRPAPGDEPRASTRPAPGRGPRQASRGGGLENLIRGLAKPLIKQSLKVTGRY